MAGVRRRISLVALVWLLAHVSTLALSFVGLCCIPPSAVAAVEEDLCCKGLAPGQMCPMHKHRAGQSHGSTPASPGTDGFALRSGCDMATASLAAMMLDISLLPDVVAVSDVAVATVVTLAPIRSVARSIPPAIRPPRA
ncbi:MAG: hypothetical protein ABL986_16620 [Vicinamibacterales bacterium]